MVMNLVGGLVYPKAAVALMVAYCVGSFAYLKGYSDTSKDVKGARYTNPLARLKPLGMLGSMILSVVACVSMLL